MKETGDICFNSSLVFTPGSCIPSQPHKNGNNFNRYYGENIIVLLPGQPARTSTGAWLVRPAVTHPGITPA